ncbi:AP-5 complex subunit beta-1 [Cryptotermes secundus]|nr:AP-5 complex subunit beta-1 [Cryptotermes secundus]
MSCVNRNLVALGLGYLSESTDFPSLLDQLIKILLEEKGSEKFASKYNVAIFIELESAALIFSAADVELIFVALKNVFQECTKENSPLLHGQCILSMTTVLLQAFEKVNEEELGVLFTEHIEFLLGLVNQTNNVNNIHIRSIAARCLTEIEICFPQILKNCVDSLYMAAVVETSIAHQCYMSLLALVISHSIADKINETSLWGKYPNTQWKSNFIQQEGDTLITGYTDLKEMVSFLVDQLPLCSTEGVAWITMQIIDMMLHKPDLQASAQVLKPLVLHFSNTYSTVAGHVVFLLEKHLGNLIFQEKDMIQLLQQLLLNSSHPSLSASTRLLYLDWLSDYLSRRPEKIASIQDVNFVLPGSFDGPETHLKKLKLLSSLLKNKKESSVPLLHALATLQKQMKCKSSIKLKSALIKVLYRYLCDHHNVDMSAEVPRILVAVTKEDISFVPFVLNFIHCVQDILPKSSVPSCLLTSLVMAFTQPDSAATLATFHFVLDIFLMAVTQDLCICQPKAILNYLMKYIVCEEVCGLLSWMLGHQILSLCFKLMSNYDTVVFFYELCEVLKMFMANSEDVDLLDRAHIYHSLLVSLSNKKLKEVFVSPKQSIMASENTFHSASAICKLDEPILHLKKERRATMQSPEKLILETNLDIPEADILKLYANNISFVAQKPLIIKGRLSTTSRCNVKLQPIQALAIFFTAPEAWGRIEPIMIGHYAVKNSSEYSESPHIVDIECFLYKPYPAVIQVRADFSIHNVCHMCTLEPLSLDLPDFFQPLPVHDEFISASVVWRRALFHSLWNSLEEESLTVSNAAFTSVCVLQQSREDLRAKLYEELHECIVEENKDFFHVGIYLFPTSHLLMKFLFKCGSTLVRIVTDDVNILAHVNSYFKTWL